MLNVVFRLFCNKAFQTITVLLIAVPLQLYSVDLSSRLSNKNKRSHVKSRSQAATCLIDMGVQLLFALRRYVSLRSCLRPVI